MTFDERLDLTGLRSNKRFTLGSGMRRWTGFKDRHEALTQTVELMAHLHQEWDKKHQILLAHVLESIDSLSADRACP